MSTRFVRVEDVAHSAAGGTPDRSNPAYFGGDIPWVKSGELNQGSIFATEETISSDGLNASAAKLFPAGTTVLALYGATAGVVGRLKVDAATNQAVLGLQAKEKGDADYLYHSLKYHAPGLLSRRQGGAQPNLSAGMVRSVKLFWPDEHARYLTSQVLSAADRAIQAADKLVAAKREFKRGLMQDLLTGRRRFPGFEGAWEERRLAEICSVNPPTKLAPDKSASVTFVPMRDVLEGGGYNGVEHVAGTRASSGYTPFQESDILVAKITPCFENGKCWLAQGLLGGFGLGSTEFHVIRPSSEVDPHWVYAHVRSERFRGKGATNMVGSAGQKRVPATFVRNYSVDVPSLKEQRAISGVLSTLDAEITHLETLAAQLREQKRGLMQRLFSGELDLSTLDTDAAADAAPREVSA